MPASQLLINDALILEATRQLASQSPAEQRINGVLRLLSEWAQLHYGRVLLPNFRTNTLQVAYAYGLSRERLARGDYDVPFDQGLTGAVWRSGQVALVTDVMDEPIFLTRIAEPVAGQKSGIGFISVPVLIEGKPIGVLSAQRHRESDRLYSQDVDLLRIVASMIASTLLVAQQRNQHLHAEPEREEGENERLRQLCAEHGIVGTSAALLSAVRRIYSARNSDAPVLLLGESGSGKEMFAQMLHRISRRARGAYIPLNCAAIPSQLLESELFGHEKGSFTGAHRNKKGKLQQADGGTLFLDEIGDMQLDLQAKLLRVLQDRKVEPVGGDHPVEVNFRLITATHINLKRAVEAGQFRLDLFFRLNVIPVLLPPLRERASDIPLLADHFLNRYRTMYRRHLNFTAGAIDLMNGYSWPGNIRQLQNVIERAVLQADGPLIDAGQIGTILADESGIPVSTATSSASAGAAPAAEMLDDELPPPALPPRLARAPRTRSSYTRVEQRDVQIIRDALTRTGGNQTRAAALLGMSLRQLRYRLAKLGS
jgi:Nif-specific regulatory protein